MLSLEEKNIIEDSTWIVNTVLKRQGLQCDDDIRQSAYLYMCKCIKKYDPTLQIKWTTYAYKSVYLYVKKVHAREIKKATAITDEDISDIKDLVLCNKQGISPVPNAKYVLDEIMTLCTPRERKLLELKMQGYKRQEIALIMNCDVEKIGLMMRTIKKKSQNIPH